MPALKASKFSWDSGIVVACGDCGNPIRDDKNPSGVCHKCQQDEIFTLLDTNKYVSEKKQAGNLVVNFKKRRP